MVRVNPGQAVEGASIMLDVVDPALIKRGVRIFVFFFVKMLKYYTKYETVVDPVLPAGVATALQTLVSELAAIQALNKPGPS